MKEFLSFSTQNLVLFLNNNSQHHPRGSRSKILCSCGKMTMGTGEREANRAEIGLNQTKSSIPFILRAVKSRQAGADPIHTAQSQYRHFWCHCRTIPRAQILKIPPKNTLQPWPSQFQTAGLPPGLHQTQESHPQFLFLMARWGREKKNPSPELW